MYRKFKAAKIFTGSSFTVEGTVLVTDENGIVKDIIAEQDAGDDVEIMDGILSPGFINAHCHLELSHMKGLIPKHTGLVDFVFRIVTERNFKPGEILQAIEKGADEMYRNGIVAVGDICNNDLTIAEKQKGRLYFQNFIEVSGFPPAIAASRFQRAIDLYNIYAAELPASSIVAHAPYSVSPELFGLINGFTGNTLQSIHNQEIPDENYLFEKGSGDFIRMYEKMNIDISFFRPSGKSSLQTYLSNYTNAKRLILVHNVALSEPDLEFIYQHEKNTGLHVHFCLCPNANLYISNMLPDVGLINSCSDRMVLGTDSLASNDQLSILEEMRTLLQHYPEIVKEKVFQWATLNGALALGIENVYGSFEKGKKPGVVLIDENLATAKRIL